MLFRSQDEAVLSSDKKEDLILKLSGMTTQSQGSVDASELLSQAESFQQLSQGGAVPDAAEGDTNFSPNQSISDSYGVPSERKGPISAPSSGNKGFAALFKKKKVG